MSGQGLKVVVVPSPPALLPEHGGLTDPLATVRTCIDDAVRWLSPGSVGVVTVDELGGRVAAHLLDGTPRTAVETADNLLVVADGSARRGEKAPGHLDERAFGFDAAIDTALRHGDADALAVLDEDLGEELLAGGVPAFRSLGRLVTARLGSAPPRDPRDRRPRVRVQVDYADDPFGVQYWVVRWMCDC